MSVVPPTTAMKASGEFVEYLEKRIKEDQLMGNLWVQEKIDDKPNAIWYKDFSERANDYIQNLARIYFYEDEDLLKMIIPYNMIFYHAYRERIIGMAGGRGNKDETMDEFMRWFMRTYHGYGGNDEIDMLQIMLRKAIRVGTKAGNYLYSASFACQAKIKPQP